MNTDNQELERIFHAVCDLDTEQRGAYLDAACSNRPEMRREIEDLLRRDASANSFLAGSAVVAPEKTREYFTGMERPGTVVGRYKLMELIGEGGFGLVFIARQEKPVRREVALKIIKPGMDTRDVIARFEAERQALALMEHPNIAKVLDAGTTDTGRPYFVMELVKGFPIVDYCDRCGLTPRERIELMLSVCRAVQHAHSKGVIHRDLKPSNILVSPHDGIPVVKVIDFGIAKAIGQQLTDRTIYTRFAQMIGTPTYMSPEQAEINALDVDIRSDVYSLGVLIYELLTGTTPFESHRFARAAYDEIRKIIREEDPPKPSTRLSTLGESIAQVSAHRQTEPAKLSATVRGDLDWIVMRCLEKDRSRRYETAASLAQDLQHFLHDEPVEACPPSVTYRTKKLLRRYRMPLAIASLFSILCVTGIIITVRQNIIIRGQIEVSEKALRSLREVALQQAISETLTGDPERVRAAIDLAQQADVSSNWTELFRGQLATCEGRYEDAVTILKPLSDAGDRGSSQLCALASLAFNYVLAGHDRQYLECIERVREQTPKTAEERLFVAGAEGISSPKRVLELLSDTQENTKYPIALAIRGSARAWRALTQRDASLLSLAKQDIRYAEFFSGDTPIVLQGKAEMLRIADEFARIRGDTESRETRNQELGDIVDKLSALPPSRYNQITMIGIYDRLDRFNELLATARAMDFGDTVWIEYTAAPIYGRSTDAREGLQRLESLSIDEDNPHGLVARAHFVAEIPELRNELISLYERIVTENQASVRTKFRALNILALAGDHERLKTDAKSLLAESNSVQLDTWGMREGLSLAAGEWEPSRLDTVDSAFTRCQGFYYLALKQLSVGDRAGAKESLKSCLDTGVFTFFAYNWAKAYLSKMESDPAWPAWIGHETSK